MKYNLFLITSLLLCSPVFAQNQENYKQKAEQIRKEIWGTTDPGFNLTSAPDSLKNESAVVLGRSLEISRTSGSRLKFMVITAAAATRTTRVTSIHERVKINDKSALEDYSTVEYQKKLDESRSMLVAKLYNVHNTYIGAKIIKPNGTEVIVNTDEEVLVKNQQKDQQGKLAVPGLEVGDIIDYYIYKYDMVESGYDDNPQDNRYVIFLTDEHPVLHYNLSFEYNSKVDVTTLYANGAPELKHSTDKDGNQILKLQLKSLPKYKAEQWTSKYRQHPYIIVASTFQNRINNSLSGIKNSKPSVQKATAINATDGISRFFDPAYNPYDKTLEKGVRDFFGNSKNLKAASPEAIAQVLYDKWKHMLFCAYDGKDMDMSNERNSRSGNVLYHASLLSRTLKELDIDNEIVAGSPRHSASLENLDAYSPRIFMVRTKGANPIYLPVNNVVTQFNYIPAALQGERVDVANLIKAKYNSVQMSTGKDTLPIVAPDGNHSAEQLTVSLNPNFQKLNITRNVTLSGALSYSEQLRLLQMEDIDKELTEITKGEPFENRLKSSGKKMLDDYQAAFSKARADVKKNFSAEIEEQFDIAPQDVSNYKVLNSGLNNSKPSLQYTATFALENLIKKAGTNLILDAGKLIGSYAKIDEESRKRTLDIYMPYARSFDFDINISIPKGYQVKGLEQLNANVKNSTGLFTSKTSLNGDTVKLSVKRVYEHNFEKVTDWPKLVELIDAAYNFSSQKILLEKTL